MTATPTHSDLQPATGLATDLRVEGMTCNNCARKVTDVVQAFPGVQSVMINIATQHASVRWKSDATHEVDGLIGAVTAAGYPTKLIAPNSGATDAQRNWHLNLWIGGIVTAVLMLGEWVFHFGMTGWFAWTSFALAGLVQVYCGAEFYRGAWRQLKAGSSNMDTLVALGSTTAFSYSVWALLSGSGHHLYFMEAAAIITLISVGHWVEARVSARASDALKALLQLTPTTARKLQSNTPAPLKFNPRDILSFKPAAPAQFTEVEVSVAELKLNDLIVLRPGDYVPVDGVVTEGNSAVNEAMLTGESLPVEKTVGAKVFTGTANLNGRLVMRVTATGEATALAHIIAAVQRAQTSRADIQRLGDKVSNVFVPIVVTIALAAGLAWAFAPGTMANVFHALAPFLWSAHLPDGMGAGFIIAAAVLIVACPCAMGLATPAAIMASANAAARRGILIRDGVALEKAGQITAIVFDKTGTLTVGKPEVAAVWDGQSEKGEARTLAAALARHSNHPISQAIATTTAEKQDIHDWRELRGSGVEANFEFRAATLEHRTLKARLGSLRWLGECDVNLTAGEKFIKEWSAQGATVVGLALDGKLAGLFAVKDTLKSGAAGVVTALQQQGLKSYLLTGDHALTAAGIAKQVGIAPENVFAEVRPEQKAEFIKKLQSQGERVAFVGDGINDAPALTQADLGIAVSRASDVAREAADIILLKSEIEAVPEALGLARATLRTIKQNLFWAFFYNAVGIPLAALGFMSPVLCAAAMGLSDIVVIGNALRLRRWNFSLR
ncbi:MAG: heavy metal translocating P-type ATPase [Verrucomicrobiota bacterium]